ncbi:MAG TPA: hypothetical protein ENI77_03760 [Nitrospirae bacterium]|nr:hypothetical protein [Nitrospirota bacterium]
MEKIADVRLNVLAPLGFIVFFCFCVAWTGCSDNNDRSFVQKSNSGSVARSFFSPSVDDIIEDKETGLEILKNIISVTFSPSTSREKAEKIIASLNGEIVGYDYSVNYYQIRFAKASARELAQARKKFLAQFKEVELASKILVSVHKDPYYVR